MHQGSTCEQNTMAEIRVVWRLTGRSSQADERGHGGHWHLDSACNRKMLSVIVDSGNEIYGPNSHWIEERQLQAVSFAAKG